MHSPGELRVEDDAKIFVIDRGCDGVNGYRSIGIGFVDFGSCGVLAKSIMANFDISKGKL